MKLKAILVAAAVSFPVAANADSFLATGFNVIDSVNVPMDMPKIQTVLAGQVQLTGPGGDLLVWCLDLIDSINLPYLYNVNTFHAGDLRPGIPSLNVTQVRQIASLMANGIDGADILSRAATQVAIWSVEYGAGFDPVGLSVPFMADVNSRISLSGIGGILDCPTCELTVLTDAPAVASQAFGYVNAVPGPVVGAGLPGLIAAGGALFAFLRRRRASTT